MWLLLSMGWAVVQAGPLETARASVDASDVDVRAIPWAAGTRVRVTQRLGGLPVWGPEQVVALDRNDRVRSVRGSAWVTHPVPTTPRLEAAAAIERATGVMSQLGRGQLWPPRATLGVHAVEAPRLAWAVDASTATPLRTWRVFVDALDGRILESRPTSATAEGKVYEVSPALGRPVRVTLEGLTSDTELTGIHASARSCDDWEIDDTVFGVTACHAASPHALPDAGGDYLFSPDPGATDDPMAEVQTYHHVDLAARWFGDGFGFDLGGPIDVFVNFPMQNAFFGDFDGDGLGDLSFGHSEDGVDFGYDADVIYHEFGHAVVSGISGVGFLTADAYGLEWAGGSLNEGTADAFSMLMTDDPYTGEYAGTSGGREGPIRDLDVDRRCPDDLEGEVHADGRVWGSLVWNLREDPAVGPALTAQLVYGAAALWNARVTWEDAGVSLLDTADELNRAGLLSDRGLQVVEAQVEAANLVDCGRVRTVTEGEPLDLFLLNAGLKGEFELTPSGTQLVFTMPEGADRLQMQVSNYRGREELGYTVFLRRDEPVRHRPTLLDALGIAIAVPETYDLAVEGAGDGLVFDLGPESALIEPGGTYYLSFAGRDLGGIELFDFSFGHLTVTLQTAVEPKPESPSQSGGCGCASRGIPQGGWLALFLLALGRRSPRG